jgi:hypothetical protein
MQIEKNYKPLPTRCIQKDTGCEVVQRRAIMHPSNQRMKPRFKKDNYIKCHIRCTQLATDGAENRRKWKLTTNTFIGVLTQTGD